MKLHLGAAGLSSAADQSALQPLIANHVQRVRLAPSVNCLGGGDIVVQKEQTYVAPFAIF